MKRLTGVAHKQHCRGVHVPKIHGQNCCWDGMFGVNGARGEEWTLRMQMEGTGRDKSKASEVLNYG